MITLQQIAYFLQDFVTNTAQFRLAYLTGLPSKLLDTSPSAGDYPEGPAVWSPTRLRCSDGTPTPPTTPNVPTPSPRPSAPRTSRPRDG